MIAQVLSIAASVAADARRRKVVWVVVLFAGLMAAAIPALPSYGVGVVEAVYREVALTLTYAAMMILSLSLAANRIPSETEKRTVYNVLARDVRRWQYLVGTWLGVTFTIGAAAAAFALVIIGIGFGTYDAVMWQLVLGVAAIWLEASVLAAFCVAVSTVAGPVIVAVASIAFLFVTHVRSSLLDPGTVGWYMYPSLDAFNVIAPIAHGDGVGVVELAGMALVFVGWVAVLLFAGVLVFARRDL